MPSAEPGLLSDPGIPASANPPLKGVPNMGRRTTSRLSRAPVLPVALLALPLVSACLDGGQAGAAASGEEESRGWAVVVGISEYENFPVLERGAPDAEKMRSMLEGSAWGIPGENIRTLVDGEATKENIRAALTDWLPSRVGSADWVVVYFSGYASRIEDTSGDEEDGIDTGFCPADARAHEFRQDIIDDELSRWLDQLPTDRVTLIVDSDHEGVGDHDPDHPGHEEHADQFDLDPIGVSRCGDLPIGWTTSEGD